MLISLNMSLTVLLFVAPDDIGVCQLIGVYTLIACWTIPAIRKPIPHVCYRKGDGYSPYSKVVFYSTYFATVVYLQSRIPVVVKSERRLADLEKGPSDSLFSWKEMLKEIVGTQCSSTIKVQPRPLVLPTMTHTAQSPGPRPASPNTPRRQSTMPSLPHTSKQDVLAPHLVPSRHRSLPAITHGDGPHIRAVLTLPITHTSPASSHPRTPSSSSYSTPSAKPFNQSFGLGPGVTDAEFPPRGHQWRSKHLSMMPSSSSSREMRTAQGSPTTRSTRTRLSKPIPAHLL